MCSCFGRDSQNTKKSEDTALRLMTSHDTFQQLNYETRLPFNALWTPKEIIATNPEEPFCKRTVVDENLDQVIKTRPRRYVSPGISLDNVDDPETRKLMVNFTYTTTTSRAAKETWRNFEPKRPCLPNTVFERDVDPLKLQLQLIPNIPVAFKSTAAKWDEQQQRSSLYVTGKDESSNVGCRGKMPELVTPAEKRAVRDLLDRNKLSLAYDKQAFSYGGFRPSAARGVALEKRRLPVVHPDLTVSQAITQRYADDFSL